jgi:crotonobetainyl-CoA:carnitine CoA-transferase CaiB-like acyl-CoA transferase
MRGAPRLGEHNEDVLAQIGLSKTTIAELRAGKIIGSEILEIDNAGAV